MPSKMSLRYLVSVILNRHSFIRIYCSSCRLPMMSLVARWLSDKILTILKPSIRADCCLIRGITALIWSIMVNSISLICAFDSYRYKPRISAYFFTSSYSPNSHFSKFFTSSPMYLMPYYFILAFLWKHRVMKNAVMKFHSAAAFAGLLCITIISLWIK